MSAATRSDGGSDELRSLFENADEPVLTAVEVAEELDVTQQAAHARLSKAHEDGWMQRKKVGSRAVVWWVKNQPESS